MSHQMDSILRRRAMHSLPIYSGLLLPLTMACQTVSEALPIDQFLLPAPRPPRVAHACGTVPRQAQPACLGDIRPMSLAHGACRPYPLYRLGYPPLRYPAVTG